MRPRSKVFPRGSNRLAVIYCLAREASGDGQSAASPAIEPMRPNDAFLQLLSASFMLDITDRSVLTRNLRFIERLFEAVAVRRLRIPDGFSSLPKVREAVLKDLGVRPDLGRLAPSRRKIGGGQARRGPWRRRCRRELHRIHP